MIIINNCYEFLIFSMILLFLLSNKTMIIINNCYEFLIIGMFL